MTLPRLDAIVRHWEVVPPLSVSVAAIASVLGVGKPANASPAPAIKAGEADPGKISELFDMLGGAGFASEKPSWLNPAAETT